MDVLLTLRRRQETESDANVPLFCMPLWTSGSRTNPSTASFFGLSLGRFGVLAELTATNHQFRDGMGACAWSDDAKCSEWLNITQGSRQRCVLAPLLFKIFFSAVLAVVGTLPRE